MSPDVPNSTFSTKQRDALDAAFQAKDATLTALAALDSSTGYIRQTGADTFTKDAAAVQADQEAETAGKVVTSDVQHFGPSAAKCWAYVTVSAGTPTLQTSYNITSITDTGVGRLTVTIATDFSSANWAGLATVVQPGASALFSQTASVAAGSIELECVTWTTGAFADPLAWSFVGFGDQ